MLGSINGSPMSRYHIFCNVAILMLSRDGYKGLKQLPCIKGGYLLVLCLIFRDLVCCTFRRHTNGRCSIGNFLLTTRSAIRQGLHNSSPHEHTVRLEDLPATILDEDEILKLDDVKMSLFSGLDTLEKE